MEPDEDELGGAIQEIERLKTCIKNMNEANNVEALSSTKEYKRLRSSADKLAKSLKEMLIRYDTSVHNHGSMLARGMTTGVHNVLSRALAEWENSK